MRKVFLMLTVLTFLLAGMSTQSFAAMTCADAGSRTLSNGNYLAHILCTVDTTPGTAVATMPLTAMRYINTGFVHAFWTKPGSTAPTDATDLAIADADGKTILKAAGNGANVIDATTLVGPFLGDDLTTGDFVPMGDGSLWTLTVTNNAVNNSSFNLYMHISPSK